MPARSGSARLDRWDGLLLILGGLAIALFLAAEHRIAGAPGLPLDDGWIHLRLAQNLAAGGGLAINPGEPVSASTAPLWSVMLAGLLAAGLPALLAAKALGLACWMGTGLVTRRLAGAAGLAAGVAWAAGLAALLLSRLVWGALSGMEVPLAALTVVAGAWAVAVAKMNRDDQPDEGMFARAPCGAFSGNPENADASPVAISSSKHIHQAPSAVSRHPGFRPSSSGIRAWLRSGGP